MDARARLWWRLRSSGGLRGWPRGFSIPPAPSPPTRRASTRRACAPRASSLRRLVDLGAAEQVIEATHPIPAIAVGLDDEAMPPVLVAVAVILGQEIDEQVPVLAL